MILCFQCSLQVHSNILRAVGAAGDTKIPPCASRSVTIAQRHPCGIHRCVHQPFELPYDTSSHTPSSSSSQSTFRPRDLSACCLEKSTFRTAAQISNPPMGFAPVGSLRDLAPFQLTCSTCAAALALALGNFASLVSRPRKNPTTRRLGIHCLFGSRIEQLAQTPGWNVGLHYLNTSDKHLSVVRHHRRPHPAICGSLWCG